MKATCKCGKTTIEITVGSQFVRDMQIGCPACKTTATAKGTA